MRMTDKAWIDQRRKVWPLTMEEPRNYVLSVAGVTRGRFVTLRAAEIELERLERLARKRGERFPRATITSYPTV